MPKVNPLQNRLEVAGQLDLLIGDIPCEVIFQGDVIVLAFPEMKNALALRNRFPQAMQVLKQLEPWLNEAGLELAVTIGGHSIGRYGSGISANWLAKRLNVAPFRIEAKGLFAAWLRRHPKELSR